MYNMKIDNKLIYHIPSLLKFSIDSLITNISGIYVDGTFGGGGHSKEILNRINNKGKLLAIDQDENAIKYNNIIDERFTLFHDNFRKIKKILKSQKIKKVSGFLLDLGVSWYQFDHFERGFSIRSNQNLDMRMNSNLEKSAKNIINQYSEYDLYKIFYNYGQLRNCRNIAKKIVEKRIKKTINTTYDLIKLFKIKFPIKKNRFLSKLFQSIRIEVNDEINSLKDFLIQSVDLLDNLGRIVIISYHSVEDRLVKNFFKTFSFDGNIKKDLFGNNLNKIHQIHRKVIKPDDNEINYNPRSRSARLRIAEKIYE